MSGLVLEGVSKSFQGLQAVADVSFDAPPGRITGLIGPNGAGKTTVINLITGVLALSAGRVRFDDEDISRLAAAQVARRGIARTFQTIRLLREASVLDNVLAGFHPQQRVNWAASLLGLPSAAAEQRALRQQARVLLDRFGMARFAD
jgi:branched-chain amino acid transport system ATP-binding protein